MCAGLAYSVGKSWRGAINSPATTFAVVIKPPRGMLSQRRGPLSKLLWADLFYMPPPPKTVSAGSILFSGVSVRE